MAATEARLSDEEIARRGDEIYETKVRPLLKKKDKDRFVAIDVETSEWEIGDTVLNACDRLEARVSKPQTWIVRVGSRYVYRFGVRNEREAL